MCVIRDYEPADYDACLNVFASNVPSFFGVEERSEYAHFLARARCPYLVAELDGRVIGGGGFYLIPERGLAGLVWGMIIRDCQRQGIGAALLGARLQRINADPTLHRVRVNTSQKTSAFFHRFGFQTERVVKNYFGEGLDRYQMFLHLNPGGDPQTPNELRKRLVISTLPPLEMAKL